MSRMYNPPHPGEVLMDGVFEDGHITVTDAAHQLRVSRVTLSRVLHGKTSVTADMALRLAQWLGGSAESWLRLQAAYDLWQVSKKKRPKVIPMRPAA